MLKTALNDNSEVRILTLFRRHAPVLHVFLQSLFSSETGFLFTNTKGKLLVHLQRSPTLSLGPEKKYEMSRCRTVSPPPPPPKKKKMERLF